VETVSNNMTTLDMLYEELADLETTREQLLSQLKAVDKNLAAIRVRISDTENINSNAGTSNLPKEILSNIFEAGLHAQLALGHLDLPFEILVSHVSRRWRAVALQTPGLWSYICLSPYRSTIDLLDIYIERSRGFLLDINFRMNPMFHLHEEISQTFSANFLQQLAILIPHAVRWRQLSVSLHSQIAEDLSVLADVCAPALQSLSLEVLGHTASIATHSFPLFGGGAPMLSSVELNEYCVSLRLPLSSVTSLVLHGDPLTQEQPHMLFMSLHCLTHLSLESNQIFCTYLPPIELPSVVSLHLILSYTTRDTTLDGPSCLSLPAVETLTVDEGHGNVFAHASSLRQTCPAVRALKVLHSQPPCGNLSLAPVLDFFVALPGIEEVSFNYHLARLVTALNVELVGGAPWPHLHTMAITAPKLPDWGGICRTTGLMFSIMALIDKRIASGHAISHLTVSEDITRELGQGQLLQQWQGRVVLEECAPAQCPEDWLIHQPHPQT
jgi:F-box-like